MLCSWSPKGCKNNRKWTYRTYWQRTKANWLYAHAWGQGACTTCTTTDYQLVMSTFFLHLNLHRTCTWNKDDKTGRIAWICTELHIHAIFAGGSSLPGKSATFSGNANAFFWKSVRAAGCSGTFLKWINMQFKFLKFILPQISLISQILAARRFFYFTDFILITAAKAAISCA